MDALSQYLCVSSTMNVFTPDINRYPSFLKTPFILSETMTSLLTSIVQTSVYQDG
jgi:hypothetical protein